MSIEAVTVNSEQSAAPAVASCLVQRADGVYVDASVPGTAVAAAINSVFAGDSYFAGLDYPVLLKLIYNHGPELARKGSGELMVRLADDIAPFDPERRQLYRAVKMSDGKAEYQFEPVVIIDKNDPYGAGTPAHLNVDEFIADMWGKGIRFGIDVAALRAAISAGKTDRVTVARRLDPVPGADAHIVEVSSDLHRSDAPRQLANGKLDLMAFQNRFPQIRQGVRLLQKVPRKAGSTGFQLSGIAIEPPVPKDIELAPMVGSGTAIDICGDGEFLVSLQAGFLNVDSKTHQLSVGDKIVSRDGVSSRTTGNLQLTGDYEEFGEVQEKRVIEGESITIHADVFGNIVSRGGTILLNQNLVGGSAHNAGGDIRVKGVASGSVLQTSAGEIHIQRAESCVISGTRVVIEHAANCEIMADELVIRQAEGCAVSARKVEIGVAGPRKQTEMLIVVLEPDSVRIDEAIAAMATKAGQFGARAAQRKADMEQLTSAPEVNKYVMLSSRIRKNELVLTPEQLPQFQKLANSVAPALKAIAALTQDMKAAETEREAAALLVAQLQAQRAECVASSCVTVQMLEGETVLRSVKFSPDGASMFDYPPKEIKARLRGNSVASDLISSASSGQIDWHSK